MDKGSREYDILKIYMKIYIFSGIVIGMTEIITHKSIGEATGMVLHMSRENIFLLLVLQTITLIMVYPIFLYTKDKSFCIVRVLSHYHFKINHKKIHIVTFVLLFMEIIFSIRTGNAIIGRNVVSRFSFIFNLFKISPWMQLYYVCARKTRSPLYWINIALYVVYQFLCGWAGQILTVFFFELYFYIKYKTRGKIIRTVIRFSDVMAVVAFGIGSYLYSYVYSWKNSIRYGLRFGSIAPLNYFEGVNALMSRFTNFPITVAAVQNHERIAQLYNIQRRPLWEFESMLSPLIPRFIMPYKEFRPLSNIVKQAIWYDLPKGNGSGYNFFVYWFNILESSLSLFVISILAFTVLVVISKKIIYAFDNGSRDVEILYFFFLFGLFSETSLSNNFGYGYTSLVYTIPFMMMVGAIKFTRKHCRNTKSLESSYKYRTYNYESEEIYYENSIYNQCRCE